MNYLKYWWRDAILEVRIELLIFCLIIKRYMFHLCIIFPKYSLIFSNDYSIYNGYRDCFFWVKLFGKRTYIGVIHAVGKSAYGVKKEETK